MVALALLESLISNCASVNLNSLHNSALFPKMYLSNLLAALSIATYVHAFTIPAGQKPGVYLARYDVNGNEEHVPVADVLAERSAATDGVSKRSTDLEATLDLEKRDTEGFWCGCGIEMDHGLCDKSVQALKDQMGGGTSMHTI